MNKLKLILKLATIIQCLITTYIVLNFEFNIFQQFSITLQNWIQFQPLMITAIIYWIIWIVDLLLTADILSKTG